MLSRFFHSWDEYPRQFWLMFFGMLISTVGSSMIWPFLMVYASARLKLPLTAVASIMTLNATMGLIFAFIAGPLTDRLGRKWVMVFSLVTNGLGYLFLSGANTYPLFAAMMALNGAVNPLYRVGADAMLADLVPPEKRADAYSLTRMSNNIGISVGPAIGGFIATSSYSLAFYLAAAGLSAYGLLLALFARETLSKETAQLPKERFGGYGVVLHDRKFISFTVVFTLTQIAASMLWVLLSVYTKTNFNMPESQYGLLPTTNAILVVIFQIAITRVTKKYPALRVLALGSLLYAVGVTSLAWGRGFWGFWLSMVVFTIGEMILMPTSSTYAANQAPETMRGRYMSIYGLTWGLASGIGPIYGGFLNDNISPVAIWYGAGLVGMISAVVFAYMANRSRKAAAALPEES
jgi:MFS family permease